MIRKLIRGDGVDDATTDDPRIEADVKRAVAGVTSIGVGPDGEILMSVGPAGSIYRLHFPTTFETGWRDVSEVQLADLLHAERAFFFSSRRRHTRFSRDWSSDVCSSD